MVLYPYRQDKLNKPTEKKSNLDFRSTESPVLVKGVDKDLDEDGL